jgi:hypothetical protein
MPASLPDDGNMTSVSTPHFKADSTLAVIAASREPLLFLSDDRVVIAASASFGREFEIDPSRLPGKQLSRLGQGEWGVSQLASLLRATASGNVHVDAYEMDSSGRNANRALLS